MSVLPVSDLVAVWLGDGLPVRMLWKNVRYRVTDTPTPLRGYHDVGLMHPLEPLIGWRFQGTSDDGETHVFDVHGTERQGWSLVAVYD